MKNWLFQWLMLNSAMSQPFRLLKEERRPSVLVVDDIETNLELMEAVFQRAGYTVHIALGAYPALDICKNYSIDMQFWMLWCRDERFELCKNWSIKRISIFFPVILLTALNDKKSKITGLECGADDFISKPFDTVELLTKVRSLLKLKELHEDLIIQKHNL